MVNGSGIRQQKKKMHESISGSFIESSLKTMGMYDNYRYCIIEWGWDYILNATVDKVPTERCVEVVIPLYLGTQWVEIKYNLDHKNIIGQQ